MASWLAMCGVLLAWLGAEMKWNAPARSPYRPKFLAKD